MNKASIWGVPGVLFGGAGLVCRKLGLVFSLFGVKEQSILAKVGGASLGLVSYSKFPCQLLVVSSIIGIAVAIIFSKFLALSQINSCLDSGGTFNKEEHQCE